MSRRRRLKLTATTVVLVALVAVMSTAAVWWVAAPEQAAAQDATESEDGGSAQPNQSTATVSQGSLATEREFNATVSHGDSWVVTTEAAGTITAAREVGELVDFGEELIRIDDKPVTVAEGSMPMYRELHKVNTRHRDANGKRLKLQTGEDVAQLQRFLIATGFDDGGDLEVDGEFGASTEDAVEDWQEAVGLPVTGRVDTSQLVFESAPVRINTTSRVGDRFSTLEVTGADTEVLVDTSTRDRSALPVGADVEIDINGTTVPGSVSQQKQVTLADGSRVWRTTISPDGELPDDVAAAKVTITQTVAEDVLLVPVVALLALSEGGFAVEVPDGPGTRLVAVEVGEVLDGRAEVSGEIAEGDEVVIPE